MKPLPNSCVLAFLLSLALPTTSPGTVTSTDAKNHIGEQAIVCGKVVGEKTAPNCRLAALRCTGLSEL
jgi:hypothetical protein